MKLLTLVVALFFVLVTAQVSAKTLTIGVDVSKSTPLVVSPDFARAAAQFTHAEVSRLQPGDWVHIRTIGDRSMAHFRAEKIRITRKNRADKVSSMVAQWIAGLPKQTLNGQGSTNLIAFLEFGEFDCANSGHVLLLTDGIEASSYIDAKDLLLKGKPLPAPDENFLAGCEVTMFGFGQSPEGELPPQAVKNARSSWQAWMKAAGASFTARINP